MVVTVRLLGSLTKYHPGSIRDDIEMALEDDSTVRAVVQKLKIPDEMPKTVLVNRVYARQDQKLQPGDVVSVLQPLAGG